MYFTSAFNTTHWHTPHSKTSYAYFYATYILFKFKCRKYCTPHALTHAPDQVTRVCVSVFFSESEADAAAWSGCRSLFREHACIHTNAWQFCKHARMPQPTDQVQIRDAYTFTLHIFVFTLAEN